MKLRIALHGKSGSFYRGSAARIYLDDVDVSKYTTRVVLTVDADDAIRAEITFLVSELDIDVPALVNALK